MDDVKSKLGNFITGQTLRICKTNIKSFYEAMSDIVPFFETMSGNTFDSTKAFEKHCNQAIEHYYDLALSHIPSKKKEGYFYLCIHGIDLNLSITYTTTLLSKDRLNSAYEMIETYGFDTFPKEYNDEEIHQQADIQDVTSLEQLKSYQEEIVGRLKAGNGVIIFKNTDRSTRNQIADTLNEIFKNIATFSKTELRKMSISSYTAIHFARNDVIYAGLKNDKDIDTLACLYDKAFLITL